MSEKNTSQEKIYLTVFPSEGMTARAACEAALGVSLAEIGSLRKRDAEMAFSNLQTPKGSKVLLSTLVQQNLNRVIVDGEITKPVIKNDDIIIIPASANSNAVHGFMFKDGEFLPVAYAFRDKVISHLGVDPTLAIDTKRFFEGFLLLLSREKPTAVVAPKEEVKPEEEEVVTTPNKEEGLPEDKSTLPPVDSDVVARRARRAKRR